MNPHRFIITILVTLLTGALVAGDAIPDKKIDDASMAVGKALIRDGSDMRTIVRDLMAPIGSADFQRMSLDNWQQLNERIVRDFGTTEMAFGKIVDGPKIAGTFSIGRTTIVVLVVQREYVDVPIGLSFLKTDKGVYLRQYFYDSQQSYDMYMKLATVTLRK